MTDIHIHRTTTDQLLKVLKAVNAKKLARARQSYLLCTAILEQLQEKLKACQSAGVDTSDLKKRIERLEASKRAHLATIQRAS